VGIDTILYKKLPYDPRQLSLISIGATQANLVVARTTLGVHSIQEMLPLVRSQPGKFTYASVGMGSINHLCMELLAMKAESQLTQIPYQGTAQATMALLTGEVDFGCLPAQAVAGQIKFLVLSRSANVERSGHCRYRGERVDGRGRTGRSPARGGRSPGAGQRGGLESAANAKPARNAIHAPCGVHPGAVSRNDRRRHPALATRRSRSQDPAGLKAAAALDH
jgi:hypothetical protein